MGYHTRSGKKAVTNYGDIPFASEVQFYADPKTKEIIHFQTKFLGKGWYAVYKNGKLVEKTRNPTYNIPENYKKVSLFSETSYHSSFGKKPRIRKYGTEDYTLQYSKYSPLGKYKLKSPVKTELKNKFAKPIKQVELQKWNFIALNWIPEDDGIKLQIQHTKSTPFDDVYNKKRIYQSKKYTMKEKKQAIKDFREYVKKHGDE